MSIKTRAYVLITLAMLGGAFFPIALKVAVDNGVNFYSFMLLSYLLATAASLTLVAATGKTKQLRSYLENPKEYIKIGLAGFAFAGLIFYGLSYAEQSISATFATIIYRMQPLLMLLFIPFVLRERISKIQVAALSLGVVGIYIALSGGNLLAFSNANVGTVLVLLALVLVSTFAGVFIKRYTTNMESTMFMFNSTSLVFAALLFLASGAQIPVLNLKSALALLYMGIPTSVFVTYFYFSAFRTLKTTFVTNYYLLSPFITALFATVLLSETIQPYYLAIAILVAIGVAMQRFDKKGGTYRAGSKYSSKRQIPIFDVTGAFLNTKAETISRAVRGNGRILAIKMHNELYNSIKETMDAESGGFGNKIFVYTDADGHLVSEDERAFISDTLGVGSNERVLMSAGDIDASEEFLSFVGSKIDAS